MTETASLVVRRVKEEIGQSKLSQRQAAVEIGLLRLGAEPVAGWQVRGQRKGADEEGQPLAGPESQAVQSRGPDAAGSRMGGDTDRDADPGRAGLRADGRRHRDRLRRGRPRQEQSCLPLQGTESERLGCDHDGRGEKHGRLPGTGGDGLRTALGQHASLAARSRDRRSHPWDPRTADSRRGPAP